MSPSLYRFDTFGPGSPRLAATIRLCTFLIDLKRLLKNSSVYSKKFKSLIRLSAAALDGLARRLG
jgi:hypothetical protein